MDSPLYSTRWSAAFILYSCAILALPGCLATQMVGEAMRTGQEDTEVIMGENVTAREIQRRRRVGVSLNGVNQSGQAFAIGSGSTNANVFSDLLTVEFQKMGYQARAVDAGLSSSSGLEAFQALADDYDVVLVGSMNLSTTSSTFGAMTGGEYASTGVTSFTVRGIDPQTGVPLFIVSTEYGKAKDADKVAESLSSLYRELASGKAEIAERVNFGGGPTSSAPASSPSSSAGASSEAGPSSAGASSEAGTSSAERPGDGGDDTAWVQRTLNDLNYACGTPDGVMGPNTRSCIRAFQQANDLDVTGTVDEATYERMLDRLQ